MALHPTEEQRQAAFSAAGLSNTQKLATERGISAPFGAIPPPIQPLTEPKPISIEGLQTEEVPIKIETPAEIPIPDVSQLPTEDIKEEVPVTDTFTSQLEDVIGDIEGRDRERDIRVRTQAQQRQVTEFNKQIRLNQANALASSV